MLSAAPFIAELPQGLAGKTTSLFTVHGRYGNNALNGDWELGITSNTSAPPQQQSQRTWKSGAPESFTFEITKIPASLTAPAATSGNFTIGGSNVKASYTDIASYEPNAIKIWARSTTTGSGVTIKDLKIKTPGVPGETVFPGTVINVSQGSGTGFQEIIIAGVDFESMSGGSVTLEGTVAMQFGNAPAPRGSSVQFHVIATHIPWVDLDVDSNNDGGIDDRNGRRGTDDRIEQSAPGKIIPVGGDRAEMLITLPAGRSATLEIDAAAADKVRVHKDKDRTQNTPLTFSPATANTPAKLDLSLVQPTSTNGTLNTWQLWVEALAPSTTAGDITFTLTDTGVQDSITMTSIEVLVDRINFKGDGNIDIRIDKTTDIGNGGLPGYAATEDVEWIRNTREKENEDETAWDTNQSAPAAFVRNKVLTAEVHFTVTPAVAVQALKIKADSTQPYGGFESTTVTYAALPSGGSEYKATFTTPAASKVDEIDISTKVFSWKVESITVAGNTYTRAIDLRNTEHRLYTVLDTPVAPMAEPWATVLEVTGQLADGAKTGAEVVTALTIGTHHSKWTSVKHPFIKTTATLIYDPSGAIRTTNGGGWTTQQFDLVGFMTSLAGAITKQQCDDNANTVAIFARSLGVAAEGLRFYGPGFTNLEPTTYFPAGSNTIEPPVKFNFHQIVQFAGKVYDPSTRKDMGGDPWVGMTFNDYLDAAFPGQRAKRTADLKVTTLTIK